MLGTAMPSIGQDVFRAGLYHRPQTIAQRRLTCNMFINKLPCASEKRRDLLWTVWISGMQRVTARPKAQRPMRSQTKRGSIVSAYAVLSCLVHQSVYGVRSGNGVGGVTINSLTATAQHSPSGGPVAPRGAPILESYSSCRCGSNSYSRSRNPRSTGCTAGGAIACSYSSRSTREGSSGNSGYENSNNPTDDSSSVGGDTGSSTQTELCGALPGDEKPHSGTTAAGTAGAGAAAVKVGAFKTTPGSGSAADEITHRIAASRARRASRLSYNCPACSISAATPVNIARHMARCCPDLLGPDSTAWARLESLPRGFPSPQHDATVALIRAAGIREQELRRRVLACVFWSGPVDLETGLPKRLAAEEAARRLGLPPSRAAEVLQRAMAAVRLVPDSSGPPLDVVYEDEHFLAVNKPVGLHTAPIHRFTGGSVVNKVIAYLNRGRGKTYGSDTMPVTLLTPHLGASAVTGGCSPPGSSLPPHSGGSIPELMPVPEPFTLKSSSVSLSSSSSSSSSDDDPSFHRTPPSAVASTEATTDCTAPHQLEPYVLHRLDMNTSGLLLFAKRQEVVAGMHRQFRERTLSKLYVAVTVGCPCVGAGLETASGVTSIMNSGSSSSDSSSSGRLTFRVDAPIDRHPSHEVARMVASTGKEASTSFAVLASNPHADLGPSLAGGTPGLLYSEKNEAVPRGASLVMCAPHTGRTHQIRVHLHHVGHPIVGDDIYGVTGPWLDRQALHAAALRFIHPLTGRSVRLSAPLHGDMAACLTALGLPQPDSAALAEAEDEWRRRRTADSEAASQKRHGSWKGIDVM